MKTAQGNAFAQQSWERGKRRGWQDDQPDTNPRYMTRGFGSDMRRKEKQRLKQELEESEATAAGYEAAKAESWKKALLWEAQRQGEEARLDMCQEKITAGEDASDILSGEWARMSQK